MAGIYIHIPFCKSRCIYCDFYSTTSLDLRGPYVDALLRELETRKLSALNASDSVLRTVYIGGGTPSVLNICNLDSICGQISELYGLENLQEFTIEANPDSVTDSFVQGLAQLPVNRVSMGVQSFNDSILRFMKRRHDSAGALRAYDRLRAAGFENLSLDLMFGIPGQTIGMLVGDLDRMLELEPEHISVYSLSYEPGTCLEKLISTGQASALSDELCQSMYRTICNRMALAGYNHYEISNFARPGHESVHNSNYWNGTPYLGIGAGAHSYNGYDIRSFNNSNLKQYIAYYGTGLGCDKKDNGPESPCQYEILDAVDRRNEYVMLALRTSAGIELVDFENRFGKESTAQLLDMAEPQISNGNLVLADGKLSVPQEKFFISNSIIVELFLEKE